MQFFFIVLLIGLVLFLFRLYHLANDDYILIKKNVTIEDIFNSAFICSVVALLFARLFYVLIHPNPIFINPLGFLLFPYFPGLSLTGGVLGGAISILIYSKLNNFPIKRVIDFFTISFIFVLPFGLTGYFLLSHDITIGNTVKLIMYLIILIFSNIYLYPKASILEIKDGTQSMLFLVFFSLTSLLGAAIDHPGINYFLTHKENFILLLVLVVSIIFVIKQEIIERISFDGKQA